jgi:hypothetical protein
MQTTHAYVNGIHTYLWLDSSEQHQKTSPMQIVERPRLLLASDLFETPQLGRQTLYRLI